MDLMQILHLNKALYLLEVNSVSWNEHMLRRKVCHVLRSSSAFDDGGNWKTCADLEEAGGGRVHRRWVMERMCFLLIYLA